MLAGTTELFRTALTLPRAARLPASALPYVLLALGSCYNPEPEPPDVRRETSEPVVTVRVADAESFQALVTFGEPRYETVDAGGETWTRVRVPGVLGGGRSGHPEVPVFRALIAVPLGATVAVEHARPVVAETSTVRLYPWQAEEGEFSPAFDGDREPPREEQWWTPPFVKDEAAYGAAARPNAVCRVASAGRSRGLELALVEVAAGRYDAATGRLEVFRSVDVGLSFRGGTGRFLPTEARNPFDASARVFQSATLNRAALRDLAHVQPLEIFCYGEELLILTPPEYLPAAQRLREHKLATGTLASVVVVNDGSGSGPDTKEEIDVFLDGRFNSCAVRFSYLLLLGDDDDIEPWILPRRYKAGEFPSDFPYAQIDADPMAEGLFPDVAVGRIPVNSLAQADVVVDKIIRYESDPPLGPGIASFWNPGFYRRTAIAAEFQCCDPTPPDGEENYRRFIQDVEEIRGHLVSRGFTVERIYTTDAESDYEGDPTPRYYTDGKTLLPPPLRPEDGFPWDGDTQDVIDAFNAGQLLFFHNDHGWSGGWSHPSFYTGHLSGLANGALLPVVVSSNCSSGKFDGTNGFAESILRLDGGGAIGVFAFTRLMNNTIGRKTLQGVVDAMFPNAYPGFGDDQVRDRLGDILNHARARIAGGQASADPDDHAYLVAWAYVRMLTLFGDPSLAVWVTNPYQMPKLFDDYVDGPALEFVYPLDGTVITAVERTEEGYAPIGRAVVTDGRARMPLFLSPEDRSGVRFFASRPGGIRTEVSVPRGR